MKTNNKISSLIGGLAIAFAMTLFIPSTAGATWSNYSGSSSSSSKGDSSSSKDDSSSSSSSSSSSKADSSSSGDSKKCENYKKLATKYLNVYYKCYNYKYYRYYVYYMKKYKQCQSTVSTTPDCDKYKALADKYLAAYNRCGYYCYYKYYCYYLNLYKKCEANLNKTGKVCGQVFEDSNSNGNYDSSDTRLANVTVTITDSKGKVHTVTTNAKGYYCASNVAVGTASVDINDSTLPADPTQVVGTDPTDVEVKANCKNWEERNGYTFPVPTGKVCGTVYEDINQNGQQDDNETGVVAIEVTIIDANSDKQTETTDANGNYCFDMVVEGSASIEVDETTLPTDATLTAGENPNSIDVSANQENDAGTDGYTLPTPVGKVCGFVLVDGQGQENVTVNLMDSEGNPHSEVTDGNGKYCFEDVPQGDATVDVDDTTLPDGAELTEGEDPSDVTVAPNVENDAGTDGYTLPIPVGNVCGQVVVDGNGQEGVTLNITDANGDVHPVTTVADGQWCANGLPEGGATVDVDESTLPAGVERVLGEDQDTYEVIAGENADAGIDGYATPELGSVTGLVYQDFFSDADYNPGDSDSPIANVPVTLTVNGEEFNTVTDADGKYLFENIPVGDAIVTIDENYIVDQYPSSVQTAGLNPSPVTVVLNTLTDAGEDGYSFRTCGFIQGVVYIDYNENGSLDDNDIRLENIRVNLQIEGHDTLSVVTTDSIGIWYACIHKPQGTKVTVNVNEDDIISIYGQINQTVGVNPNDVNINIGFLTDAGEDGFSSGTP